ncbi:MAG: sulfotransferase [Planctomycetota bacterium]
MNLSTRIARFSPLAKLAVWAASVVAMAACLEAGAWLIGADFSVLEKNGGSTSVILIAFGSLLAMMAVESRPMADYGLIADAAWHRRAGLGLAIGAGCYAVYCLAVGLAGVFVPHPEEATAGRLVAASLTMLAAGPVAVTQQIIFSGYLQSTLRDRHSRAVAVALPAVLFGLATAATARDGLTGPVGQRLFVGMLIFQAVLGSLRLRTGSIVFPAGLLAGCIAVRKFVAKSHLLGTEWSHPAVPLLAPDGDPRQAPMLWGVLAASLVGVAIALARWGERRIEPDAGVDASFKRYMPLSNLLGLAPLDCWLPVLWQARWRIGLPYVPRAIASLIGSTLMTLLSLPERLLAPLMLRHTPPPPVFIVGMNRSGTTHLHNLLALDPQFRSPRNHEAFNPHGFLTGWLTTALLTPLMTWRRPMDSVQMTVFTAQEEEFALACMGAPSPYWSFCLPREIAHHDRYWHADGFSESERRRWQSSYRLLMRKLTAWRRQTPLLKNPANTGRVAMLAELFPGAKFVHIVRHPHDVWRSNQRLTEHGLAVFQLQTPYAQENFGSRALDTYRGLMDAFYRDSAALPDDQVAEVRFEDVEADPQAAVLDVYRQLGLTPSAAYLARLSDYMEGVRNYRKNRHAVLDPADRAKIDQVMAPYLAAWGYTAAEAKRAA